jgi:hypothetical protein
MKGKSLCSVLHHAIADQALSLQDMLRHCRGGHATAPTTTATTMAKWETDLHLSATARCLPLTLFHLLGWIDHFGGYLFFVLSMHLRGSNAMPPPPHPPGQPRHQHHCTVAAIAVVVIPAMMTPRNMPTIQPTIFYMPVT